MKQKYNYEYIYNGKPVSKQEFLKHLAEHCIRCNTNYDNPLMNIGFVDYDLLTKKFNRLKRTGILTIFVNDTLKVSDSFKIKKTLLVNERKEK